MTIIGSFILRWLQKSSRWQFACGALLVVFLFSGCGSDQLETAPVHGTVTLDGKPLVQGQVLFTPPRGRGAKGLLNSDGTYKLTTYTDGDGGIVGPHKVTISPIVRLDGAAAEAEMPAKGPVIPVQYTSSTTSGLTYEVRRGQKNQADFHLNSP